MGGNIVVLSYHCIPSEDFPSHNFKKSHKFPWQSLQSSWTSSLEWSAKGPQTTGLVI